MTLHNAFHVLFLVLFFGAIGIGFLGLIRPLLDGDSGLKLPGWKATAALFLAAAVGGAGDWILHRYIM